MIQLTPQHRLFVHIQPIDFRKGIDGLVGICRSKLKQNAYDGTFFVFRNRTGTAVKILVYDGTGFWLMHKRFSRGKLKQWPSGADQTVCALTMIALLNQGQLQQVQQPWRALPAHAA